MKNLNAKEILKTDFNGANYGKLLLFDLINNMNKPLDEPITWTSSFNAEEHKVFIKECLKTHGDRVEFSKYNSLSQYLLNAKLRFYASLADAQISMLKIKNILYVESFSEILNINFLLCTLKNDIEQPVCSFIAAESSLRNKNPAVDEFLLQHLHVFIESFKRCFAIENTFILISEILDIPSIKVVSQSIPIEWVDIINEYIDILSKYPDNQIYSLLNENGYQLIDINKLRPDKESINNLRQNISNLSSFDHSNLDELLM